MKYYKVQSHPGTTFFLQNAKEIAEFESELAELLKNGAMIAVIRPPKASVLRHASEYLAWRDRIKAKLGSKAG